MEFTGELLKDIVTFTNQLKAEEGLFFSLLYEKNDWAFIIKLNAFVEAAITELVVKAIQNDKIRQIIARLDIADARFGKVVWLKALNILNAEDHRCVRALAELRNFFVHNITRINLSLVNYIAELDKNQLKSFIENFGYNARESIEIGEKKIPKAEFIRENPKLTIWLAVYFMLGSIIIEFDRFGLQEKELELIKEKAEVLDEILKKMRIVQLEARKRALLRSITKKRIDS